MDKLVEQFEGLRSAEARLSTLKRIVEGLSPRELEAVNAMVSDRMDHLGRLPCELVQHIFSYLPLRYAWSAQRVCKRWRATLAQDRFLATRLAQEGAIGRYADPAKTVDRRAIQHKVRHIQALKLGRPFSYCTLSGMHLSDAPYERPGRPAAALKGHNIAYIRDNGVNGRHPQVVVMNLITGHEVVFAGEARESISCITLTESLLAFVTYNGSMYVARLDTTGSSPPVRMSLPSARLALVGDRDTIVLLGLNHESEHGYVCGFNLTVYDAAQKSLTTHDFPMQCVQHDETRTVNLCPENILVDEEHDRIEVFSFVRPWLDLHGQQHRKQHAHFGHMRFALSELGSTVQHQTRSSIRWIQDFDAGVTGRIHYTGVDQLYRIERDASPTDTSLIFDAESARLYIEPHTVPANTKGDGTGTLLRWRDAFYIFESSRRAIYTLTTDDRSEDRKAKHQSSLLSAQPFAGHRSTAFANGSYIVVFEHPRRDRGVAGAICIYSFEEGRSLHNGESTKLWRRARRFSNQNVAAAHGEEQRTPFMLWTPYEHKLPYQDYEAESA